VTVMRIGWSAPVGIGDGTGSTDRFDPDLYVALARMIEKSGVEFLAIGETARRTLSPAVLASVIASETTTLGVVPTIAISDYAPFQLAKFASSLDHASSGRSGWQPAVSRDGVYEYALVTPASADVAYQVADEYMDVCTSLWDGWAPGSLIEDYATGQFADPDKVRASDHEGTYFRVKGPLNVARAPQGRPLIVQEATTSEDLDLAVSHADVIVVGAPTVVEAGKAVADLRAKVGAAGRSENVKVYVGVAITVADSPETAATLRDEGDATTGVGRRAIQLVGPPDAIADELEQVFLETGADGLLVHGDWSAERVTNICNRVFASLRRTGRLAPPPAEARLLRDRVLG
jgi:alkanesulfonate monooxygenase SsuD/methylene tetrahydromethanopterin reductase-like flavin-dependent oxidoreductase (luciferase family)